MSGRRAAADQAHAKDFSADLEGMAQKIFELSQSPILMRPPVERWNEELAAIAEQGWVVTQIFSQREIFGVRWFACATR